jgi:hypothetical protein
MERAQTKLSTWAGPRALVPPGEPPRHGPRASAPASHPIPRFHLPGLGLQGEPTAAGRGEPAAALTRTASCHRPKTAAGMDAKGIMNLVVPCPVTTRIE